MANNGQNYCTLYIVRHGQTDWNLKEITQGETNIPLNNKGIKQAKALGKNLKNIHFDVVFSSDLIRAKQTAEVINLERKLAIKTAKALRERRYGKHEGTPQSEMKEIYDTWEKLSKKERLSYKPYESYETDEEIIGRYITFLREVAVLYLGKTVLIVSHGGVMRVLLNHLSEKIYFTNSISNAAFIKLESDGVDFFIKELKGIKNPDE
ncbi:MAG: histidine phosphatase family protein [Candidatus Daviesbacteria bacterium]|nr:histidine phosphatase family protein [Candidatus Daviesbacteria bacterium]